MYADPAFQSSAGIERYAQELIRGLARSDLADRLVLLTTRPEWAERLRGLLGESGPRVATTRLSYRALRYAWSFAGWPPLERVVGEPVALAHTPANICMVARRGARLVTVHDVFPSKVPELQSRRDRLVLTTALERRSVGRCSHFVADSSSTRDDLVELFGVAPERITVVPLGIDHARFHPVDDPERLAAVRRAHGIPERFVLYVGSLYSRKIGNLLPAFARVTERPAGRDLALVVVGGRAESSASHQPVHEQVRALGLADRVIFTGPVPDDHVPALMSAATLFAYVSFYEGFGLTPLEAMACGAPVVTSNLSSIPEVVGDGAMQVDPHDTGAIAEAMAGLLDDDAARHELAERGRARAATFSWGRTTRETLAVYRRLI